MPLLHRAEPSTRLLFWGPTLIWASTWHVILYQLAEVPAINAVAWRFALASALLFAIAAHRGEAWRLPLRLQPWLLLMGTVQFGLNYWGVYEAERFIPSGLVAVLFSLMVFGNAATGALFFGQPITRRFALSALVGVAGVALIFWPEVLAAGARPQAATGVALGLGAVLCACTGNALSLRLSRQDVPLVPLLAWGMGYGALSLVVVAGATGTGWQMGHTAVWWGSLVYLAAIGSVVPFLLYFKLILRKGPGHAALTGVLVPVIALVVSALFEGWRASALSVLGMALCLGSVFAATRPAASSAAREAVI